MSTEPIRYRSPDEDSARWLAFEHRPGDIVISTRSKSGTTWMQMICALLVLRTPALPRPLSELSPWLDWLGAPLDEVLAALRAQRHRRFVKTHTPLDGLPLDERVTYIVVARHPLDAAVSLHHQRANLDRARIAELTGGRQPGPTAPPPAPSTAAGDARQWLRDWIDWSGRPADRLDSLPGVLWHLSDAWARRAADNVVLVHFDDLLRDLPAEMTRLARTLGEDIDGAALARLSEAARFGAMRERSQLLAPDTGGVLKSTAEFFRRGTSGAAAELLDETDLARYRQRAEQLAPADLLAWLHRGDRTIS